MTVIKNSVSIHQPSYFPWLGLLDKINKSSLYIYMDEVQLADRAFQHRNIFLTSNGTQKYLTVNTSKKEYRKKNISELTISNENWSIEHLNFLKENYKKHPYFKEIFPYLVVFFEKKHTLLSDVLYESMQLTFKLLNITTPVVKMSKMNYDRTKTKSDLILELIQKSNYNTYLSGQGAKDYMDIDFYKTQGIDIIFQTFKHPKYEQKNSSDFNPGLSILDVLFNIGIEETRKLIH